MDERYKVVSGSQSSHCCFEWTVVDTAKPLPYGDGLFEPLCECWEKADADLIAAGLNACHP